MHSGRLRQVGELVVITVPPAILERLGLRAGTDVGMAVEGGRLVIEPSTRPRYSLEELLAQCDPSNEDMTAEDRDWFAAPAEGRELL